MLNFSHLWVFILLPLPYLVWRFAPARNGATAVKVPFGERLRELLGEGSVEGGRRRRLIVPLIVWFLLVASLARPQWIGEPIKQSAPTRDLLLLVDLSGSMEQMDFTSPGGEKVSRLAAVKDIVGDFLEKRVGDRVGLVVFGDSPYLQAPFSTDLSLSRQLLDETMVGMAGPSTALGDALGLGIHLFENSTTSQKTVIVLTDGNDTKSQVPPVEAARVAKQNDIRVYTVAIGDPTTVGEDKLDQKTLDSVAQTTGGKSYFAGDRKELENIYKELDQLEAHEVKTLSFSPRHDLYFIPLLIGLLLSMVSKVSLNQELSKRRQARSLRVNPSNGQLELSPEGNQELK